MVPRKEKERDEVLAGGRKLQLQLPSHATARVLVEAVLAERGLWAQDQHRRQGAKNTGILLNRSWLLAVGPL